MTTKDNEENNIDYGEFVRIAWPVERILDNPDVIIPISNRLGITNWEAIYMSFYRLLEVELSMAVGEVESGEVQVNSPEDLRSQYNWTSEEVLFIHFYEAGVIHVVGDSGIVVQLEGSEGDYGEPRVVQGGKQISGIRNSEDFQISSTLYSGFIESLEKAVPEHKGDIVLCDPPVPSNNYLRDEVTDNFVGQFHLISDTERRFNFCIQVDSENRETKATVVEVTGEDGE